MAQLVFVPFLMGISEVALAAAAPLQWLMLCLRTACRSSLAHGGSLTQRARDGGLSRGCTAQLVFVPFLMGILEVVSAPPVPSSSGTAVAAHSVLKSGSNRLSTGEVRQFWRVLVETAPSEPFHWLRLGTKPRFDP